MCEFVTAIRKCCYFQSKEVIFEFVQVRLDAHASRRDARARVEDAPLGWSSVWNPPVQAHSFLHTLDGGVRRVHRTHKFRKRISQSM